MMSHTVRSKEQQVCVTMSTSRCKVNSLTQADLRSHGMTLELVTVTKSNEHSNAQSQLALLTRLRRARPIQSCRTIFSSSRPHNFSNGAGCLVWLPHGHTEDHSSSVTRASELSSHCEALQTIERSESLLEILRRLIRYHINERAKGTDT